MLTGIWTSFLFALACAATAAWLAACMREKGIRPVRALAAFLGGQPKAGRVLLAALLAALWIAAVGKPGGPRPRADGAADARVPPARALAPEDFARGFVLTRAGTGEASGFDAPSNAVVCADWEAFGAAEDWIYLSFTNWSSAVGTSGAGRLRVRSDGRADPLVPAAGGAAAPEGPAPSQFSLMADMV